MNDQTKKVIRFASTAITVTGVVGLYVSGSTEADVAQVIKLGSMIASVIGAIITAFVPRSK